MYLPTEHKFESKSIGHKSYNHRKSRDMKKASFLRMTHASHLYMGSCYGGCHNLMSDRLCTLAPWPVAA